MLSVPHTESPTPEGGIKPGQPHTTLTVADAAKMLMVSRSFVYKLMEQGLLAYERRGRRKLPLTASVSEYRLRNLVLAQNPAEREQPKRRKQPYTFKYL